MVIRCMRRQSSAFLAGFGALGSSREWRIGIIRPVYVSLGAYENRVYEAFAPFDVIKDLADWVPKGAKASSAKFQISRGCFVPSDPIYEEITGCEELRNCW